METTEKLKEIKEAIVRLKKLRENLWKPTEDFIRLRKEIKSSIKLLEGNCESIERATKKNFNLVVKQASRSASIDDEMMDSFFKEAIRVLDEAKKEIEENCTEIKERR